ncbi:MAG TPA: hypothetical protein VFI47_15835 [Acidimicrobiales bacterium]|nr:hypothetical protein [Acidimicrobiales bacterium]
MTGRDRARVVRLHVLLFDQPFDGADVRGETTTAAFGSLVTGAIPEFEEIRRNGAARRAYRE